MLKNSIPANAKVGILLYLIACVKMVLVLCVFAFLAWYFDHWWLALGALLFSNDFRYKWRDENETEHEIKPEEE